MRTYVILRDVMFCIFSCDADAVRPVDPPGILLEAYLLDESCSVFDRRNSRRLSADKVAMQRRRSLIQASMLSRGSDESKRTSASSRRGTMFSQQSHNTLDLIIRDHSVQAVSSSELYCVEANKLRDLILDVCACTLCLLYAHFVCFLLHPSYWH